MAEESTTPDLVELARRSTEAGNTGDFDLMLSFWGPNPVWDLSPMGLGTYEGPAAIRGFFEDWTASYEEFEMNVEEVAELGRGVTFGVLLQNARPVGSSGTVAIRYASVGVWVEGKMVRVTNCSDVDEARAAAERLAESRG